MTQHTSYAAPASHTARPSLAASCAWHVRKSLGNTCQALTQTWLGLALALSCRMQVVNSTLCSNALARLALDRCTLLQETLGSRTPFVNT